jgi:hypothetical protein
MTAVAILRQQRFFRGLSRFFEQYRKLAWRVLYRSPLMEQSRTRMKVKSIVAIEVSMALTGIAMIGLMVVASYL